MQIICDFIVTQLHVLVAWLLVPSENRNSCR